MRLTWHVTDNALQLAQAGGNRFAIGMRFRSALVVRVADQMIVSKQQRADAGVALRKHHYGVSKERALVQ
jgi:hypothetical protein